MSQADRNRAESQDLERGLRRYTRRLELDRARGGCSLGARWLGFSGATAAAATLAPAAHAAVIYSGVQNLVLELPNYTYIRTNSQIDLDGDGQDDVVMYIDLSSYFSAGINDVSDARLLTRPDPAFGSQPVAAQLASGETIGPSQSFEWNSFGRGINTLLGVPSPASEPGLFGLRLAGERYAWLRVRIGSEVSPINRVEIIDWAYESNAGQSIGAGVVPEPSTAALTGLGLLALGAVGLRRERARRTERRQTHSAEHAPHEERDDG